MEKYVWPLGAVLLAGVLVACGDNDNDNTDVAPAAGEDMVGTDTTVEGAVPGGVMGGTYPVVENSPTENGVAAIPSAYRGKWAANANACDNGWWRFGELDVETAGETSCQLTSMENPAGSISTTLVLSCVNTGVSSTEVWDVSQPQGGQLVVKRQMTPADGEAETMDAVPLVECPATAADAAGVPSTVWARG